MNEGRQDEVRQDEAMRAAAPLLPIAAIVHDGKHMTDHTLVHCIDHLRKRGWAVRGLVSGQIADQATGTTSGKTHCQPQRTVRDLHTGQVYTISQNLGTGSTACCLDVGALLDAASVLHRAREAAPDLVVVNRFGILEADGGGFAQEMLDIMADGLPLLTVVSTTWLAAWRTFTGGLAQELAATPQALAAWARCLPAAQRLPLNEPADNEPADHPSTHNSPTHHAAAESALTEAA